MTVTMKLFCLALLITAAVAGEENVHESAKWFTDWNDELDAVSVVDFASSGAFICVPATAARQVERIH